MKSIMKNYNSRILDEERSVNSKTCNCCNKSKCPLNGMCLQENILCKILIICNQRYYKGKVYFGVAETSSKQHYAIQLQSFTPHKK